MFKNNPFFVLIYLTVKYGKINPRKCLLLFFFLMRALLSLPFYVLQSIIYRKRIQKTAIENPPIFILGHFRSGTTLLHKLLVTDDRFGYLTVYDILCPNSSLILGKKFSAIFQRVIHLFKIKNYHFNNSILNLHEPGEEDMILVSKASPHARYWGFVFPLDWSKFQNSEDGVEPNTSVLSEEYIQLIKQITYQNKGKQLVLKNPPNTGRVAQLLKDFPNAKFIYIHRNPFTLYYSMKNLWNNAIIKYYALQKLPEQELDNIIFSYYKNLIEHYEKDKKLIPEGNLVELAFEQLEEDPYEVVKSIYFSLNLPDFEHVSKALKEQLELEKRYTKFNYSYEKSTLDKIEKRWGSIINMRNYKKLEVLVKDGRHNSINKTF